MCSFRVTDEQLVFIFSSIIVNWQVNYTKSTVLFPPHLTVSPCMKLIQHNSTRHYLNLAQWNLCKACYYYYSGHHKGKHNKLIPENFSSG